MGGEPQSLGTKTHFEILDGLRGVAALMVVAFHTFEVYADDDRFKQIINHGYLAVGFFFLLSGFVVAYAYDDRWGGMTLAGFFKRRLIRLQPMVIMGSVIGAALFTFQRAPLFPLVATTPPWKVLVVMLVGCTLVPLLPSMDIRGWQEMHPLDGPAWSLFFEYIANILYAAGVRKLSNRALGVLVFLAAAFLVHLAVFGGRGDVIGGWSVDAPQLHIGFARMLYPFFAGVLLMRMGKRIRVKGAFAVCSLLLVASFSLPRFGGADHLWMNGLYEAFCIVVVFPLIVAIGAGERAAGAFSSGLCQRLGQISYPLYITHFPLIYVYTAWVTREKIPVAQGAAAGVLLFFASIAIAYVCLRFYDVPLRERLQRRFLGTPGRETDVPKPGR